MGSLAKSLSRCKVVGIDTPIFLYHLENHPLYIPLTKELLGGIERGRWNGITSVITLMEITVHPWKAGFESIARQYETLLVNFPNLTVGDIDREVARLAAQLRAKFGIRPPDALQLATSLHSGAEIFITNDRHLIRVEELIKVLILDDLL